MRIEPDVNTLMRDLQRAGVRELKFVGKNVAIDQMGRKIIFKRTITKGLVHQTFEIAH